MTSPFKTSLADGVAEIIFDKPPVNAFNSTEYQLLADYIEGLGGNDAVRAIIIAANGKGFCAGVDLHELVADKTKIVAVNQSNYAVFKAIHLSSKPVIVAVHGYVLGSGIGISGAADIIIASTCATFGVPEIDRGAMGGGAHLQRMFSVQKVRYMYFTGEFISAAEAYRLGAVERVVERDELLPVARQIAAKIASKSPAMVALAKEALNGVEDGDLEHKYRTEQGFTLQAYTMEDSTAARVAVIDKQGAKFSCS